MTLMSNTFFIIFTTISIVILIGMVLNYLMHTPKVEKLEEQHTLGLLLIAKNESMVINEFIEHYLWQGVEKIYLIDNGSTDTLQEKVKPYIESGIVKYFYRDTPYNQENHYNEVYNKIRHECKWLIICDVDEYIYNKQKGSTIKDYLSRLDYNSIAAVYVQWKMFGSSGFEKQPESIRKSFLYRAPDIHINTKAIINTKHVFKLHVHHHEHDKNVKYIYSPPELALNHYAIMSKEYFQTVKMTRGDVASQNLNSIRDWKYFNDYDTNSFHDDELANLVDD